MKKPMKAQPKSQPKKAKPQRVIAPQPGPQTQFLASSADVVLYGGQRGGGKTFAELLEPLRHIGNSHFNGLIMRRVTPSITNQGGLWDTSLQIYPLVGGVPTESRLLWTFPSGAKIKFSHCESENDLIKYQGSQMEFIGFDELCEFTAKIFWTMFACNRSVTGIKPYIRCTCNPDPDSFVYPIVKWWLDENEEYADLSKSGVIRYFVNINDEIYWADTAQELINQFGSEAYPKSFTFIPSSVFDNQILMKANPEYLANLNALPYVERMRFLKGNWKLRYAAGNVFKPEWWQIIDALPVDIKDSVRFWDFAGTVASEKNRDPDWTQGTKQVKLADGRIVITDCQGFRESPLQVENNLKNIASQDGKSTRVGYWIDPGQAGKAQDAHLRKLLMGYNIVSYPAINDKLTNAKPYAAQVEAGNVVLLRGDWNEAFIREHTNFEPNMKSGHDDRVDSASGGFKMITQSIGFGIMMVDLS